MSASTDPSASSPGLSAGSSSPWRRLAPAAGVLLLLALGAGYAARGSDPSQAAAGPALPVATRHLEPVTSYLTTHAFTGKLKAPARTELGFERAGRVLSTFVNEGQVVEAGASLAALDSSVAAAQLKEARGQLESGRARLAELVAGPEPEDLDSARERVTELKAQLTLAGLTRARQERLAREGVISPEGNDRARSEEEAARARLAQAKNVLTLLERGTRREQVDAQRGAVLALEGRVATLEVQLRQCVLRAPFRGCVVAVHTDPGSVVAPGAPVLTLSKAAALEAWVGVPPGPAEAMPIGSEQLVLIEGEPHRARVQARLPELDRATRTATLVLSVSETEGLLPEQIVRLVLPRQLPTQGAWIPLSALGAGERATWSLFAVVPGEGELAGTYVVERRLIEVLHTEPGRALVRGNFQPDEAYVSQGVHRVVPGQRVLPSPERAQ